MAGDVRNNIGFRQAEPLITVEELKQRYLFGIEIKDANGNDLPEEAYQTYINNAVSWLEHELDLAIMPRSTTAEDPEEKDYHMNDYYEWGYIQLNNYPVISVDKLQISYLRDNDGQPQTVMEIPKAWIRLNKQSGIIRLVPNNRFPSQLQVGAGGAFFPELFRRHGMVPDLWVAEYTYGFEPGKIPVLMNKAIGLLAAMDAMSIGGYLVIGAAIASQSISIDGLSSSISTTQSAENSGYSATRREYHEQLFGKTKDDRGLFGVLKDFYKGSYLNII